MLASRRALRCALLASGMLTLASGGTPLYAQGKLEAHYTVTLAGIPIGKGSWLIDINDTQYAASASGVTTGLIHAFTGGEGHTSVRGTLNGGRPATALYMASIRSRKRTDEVRLTLANGNIKDFKLDPPQDKDAERVPLTEAHRHGVLDPMTASIVRLPGSGSPLVPEACQRTLAVFDGKLRYDLQLAYKRMDKVKSEKGYAGPVVVCAVYFSPIAGFVPSRTAIRYLSRLRDMEVWLAPLAGTRVLVPFRAQGPTPIGEAVLQATEFVSVAAPAKGPANGTKTQ